MVLPMENLILVVDIGTQSTRASIVSDSGQIKIIKVEKYEEPYLTPKNGYVEQHPDFYYDCLCKCTKAIADERPDLMQQIKSLVIAAFRDTACYLNENKEVIRNSILWLDQRSAKLKKKMPWVYDLAFALVGMTNTVIFNRKRTPALWIQENEPELWEKTSYYVPLTTYWNYRLTGELKDSNASVIGHYPINFKNGKWYGKYHYRSYMFNVPLSKLCPLVEAGQIIGRITNKASIETGIPEGVNLIASGTDKTCEVLGNGVLENTEAAISYGTACCIDVPNKKFRNPEPFLPAYKAPIPGSYNLEVQIYRGYWMLKWFIKEFASLEEQEAKLKDLSVESLLDQEILKIEPGCNGLVLQPYWGPGLRRPLARGSIIGFSDTHTKYHVYRAIIEGIAFALREGMESIQSATRKKIKYLVVSGGGSKNDIVAQITADIFNLPVKKTETVESCTLGAAISGFIAEGVFQNASEAKTAMIRYVKEFTPNKEAQEKYEYLYKKVYKKIYPRLNKTYSKLKEFSNDEIL